MSAPSRWNIQHEALHADCKVFRVFKEHCIHPLDHREGVFFVIKSNDWALALPVTTQGELVMVRQYRFGRQSLSLEPPGGVVEKGEDPCVAAAREAEEETGYSHGQVSLLGSCAVNPAIQANQCHFVLLEGVTATGKLNLDSHEEIEVVLKHPRAALEEAEANPETHSLALLALHRLRHARPQLFL
jgi:8-oxo-dGTP pyrophosphatase MutT (NUDIX family)